MKVTAVAVLVVLVNLTTFQQLEAFRLSRLLRTDCARPYKHNYRKTRCTGGVRHQSCLYEKEEEDDEAPRPTRPPIIPFDGAGFAREDIPTPPPKQQEGSQSLLDRARKMVEEKQVFVNPTGWIEDPNRPTGYGRPDLDDDEDEMFEKMIEEGWMPPADESPIQKWIRETYVGSPYDSRKKRQARGVVINITAICIGIGLVFTGIWFAFPGKFISVRGDRDFSARYAQDFVPPDGLLSDEWLSRPQTPSSGDAFFDDARGLPEQEQTRFPYDKSTDKPIFQMAPPPRLDL